MEINVELTDQQDIALGMLEEWFYLHDEQQIFTLSGYAGVGKTFLISYFVKNTLKFTPNEDVVFCAPTGKAAVVLMKKGILACTIHKLIYDVREIEETAKIGDEEITVKRKIFVKKKDLEYPNLKLIVLDEASMVSDKMMEDLSSFGFKILAVGDDMQLPAINSTATLLEHPDFTISQIVRQAEDNPIIKVATMVRNGEQVPYGNYGGQVLVLPKESLSKDRRKYLLTKCDQVICGLNKTRYQLNKEIAEYNGFNPNADIPQDGEKVISLVNKWEKFAGIDQETLIPIAIVNGLVGYVRNAQSGDEGVGKIEFKADFLQNYEEFYFDEKLFRDGEFGFDKNQMLFILKDGSYHLRKRIYRKDFSSTDIYKAVVAKYVKMLKSSIEEDSMIFIERAYALSAHKSQGSEWNSVTVIDESRFFPEPNRWLYTACTRAKEKLVIIR